MEAVLFMGIQGAGKSSYFRERFFSTHLRISMDLMKTRHREGRFLELCLESGMRFVVDNTNTTREERSRYILPAKGITLQCHRGAQPGDGRGGHGPSQADRPAV